MCKKLKKKVICSDLTSDTISCRENVVNSGSYRLRAVAPFGV